MLIQSAGSGAHGVQVPIAGRLDQTAHGVVEIPYSQFQVVGDEVIGAAATGDDPCLSDLLHTLFHQGLHLGVGLLARVAHASGKGLRRR